MFVSVFPFKESILMKGELILKKKRAFFVNKFRRDAFYGGALIYIYCKPTLICDDFISRFTIDELVRDQALFRPMFL